MQYSRVRTRSDRRTNSTIKYWLNRSSPPGLFLLTQNWAGELFSYEYIFHDVVGDKRRTNHPAQNLKFSATVPMVVQPYIDVTSPEDTYSSYGESFQISHSMAALSNLLFEYTPLGGPVHASYQNAVNEAFVSFSTEVPEIVSIANFIYELREIRSLIPKISKSLIKTTSGGLLNLEFGWKPLISDLKKLGSIMSEVEKRIAFLIRYNGERRRLGFTKEIPYPGTLPVSSMYYVYPNFPIRYKLVDYRALFRAGGFVFQSLDGLNSELSQIRAFSAALGLNNPTKIIWNALPYSFVVDWFANVGGQLDRLAIQPYEGKYELSNMTCSLTQSYYVEVWQEYHLARNLPRQVGTIRIDVYNRSVGLPVGATVSLLSPNQKQQLLGSALLIQRL